MLKQLFSRLRQKTFALVPVNLGKRVIQIPVADIIGNYPGKTLLVTGGVDGDEYAGIEAAYALAHTYQDRHFCGRLIVIPIVNLPGFETEQSQNPIDHEFPKNIFPGRANGSASERLIHWLAETYVSEADTWYDAHSGALTERLNPFIWTYKTNLSHIDAFIEKLHASLPADRILYEAVSRTSKATQVATKGCAYIMGESGERGVCRAEDIERHLQWIYGVMSRLEMIDQIPDRSSTSPIIMHKLSYICAPYDGLWRPAQIDSTTVHKGQVLGRCSQLDADSAKDMKAATNGKLLWWKETLHMKRGEVLCAWAK